MDIFGDEIKEVLAEHMSKPHWSKEDLDELAEATKKVGFKLKDLAEAIPKRGKSAIRTKLLRLRKE